MNALFDALVQLLPAQFEEVVFRLAIPARHLSPSTVAQATRALEVVRYVEQQGRAAELCSAIHRVGVFVRDDATITTTPTPQESTPVTDYSTRPIHAAHKEGVVHLIRETLTNLAPAQASHVHGHLFADDATYAELPDFSEEGARLAIRDAVPGVIIPATRVTALVLAVRSVTPARRFCARCGRLDLALVAARWQPVTADYCRAVVDGTVCEGLFASVAFDPDVRAWTDGRMYPPGTTHDDARLPITDTAIRQWFVAKGGEVHLYLSRGLTATQGALDLPALCAYLVASRLVASPLAALNALAKPLDASLCHDAASAEVLCRKALESRAPTPAATRAGGGAWDAARRKRLRDALATLFTNPASVAMRCDAAGIDTSRVTLHGAAVDMWFSAISEAGSAGRLDALLASALSEYPRSFVLSDV